MTRFPSLFKIVTIDATAFISLSIPVISGLVYLLLSFQERDSIPIAVPVIFGIISFFALITLVWRIQHFRNIFDDGQEVNATINNVWFFRDRGKIVYFYLFQGQKYVVENMVMKTKSTKSIQIGSELVALVDRNNPKRAVLRDLFL